MGVYKKLFKYVPEKKYLAFVSMFLAVISAFLSVFAYYVLWQFLYSLLVTGDDSNSKKFALVIVGFFGSKCAVYFLSHMGFSSSGL